MALLNERAVKSRQQDEREEKNEEHGKNESIATPPVVEIEHKIVLKIEIGSSFFLILCELLSYAVVDTQKIFSQLKQILDTAEE